MTTDQLFKSNEAIALDTVIGGKGIDLKLPKNYIEISISFTF